MSEHDDRYYEAIRKGVYDAFFDAFQASWKESGKTLQEVIHDAVSEGVSCTLPSASELLHTLSNHIPYGSHILDAIRDGTKEAIGGV